MDITPEKITEILSDPQKISMISSIIGSMNLQEDAAKENTIKTETAHVSDDTQNEKNETDEINDDIPVSSIVNILPKLSTSSSGVYNERINLLKAVRPFLSDSRKQKVDSLVKALGAASVIGKLKDTDIFKLF